MKGAALPIEAVVILGIALVVLIAIVFLIGNFFGISSSDVERERALQEACNKLVVEESCDIDRWSQIEVTYTESGGTSLEASLQKLCEDSGFNSQEECAKRCGCAER